MKDMQQNNFKGHMHSMLLYAVLTLIFVLILESAGKDIHRISIFDFILVSLAIFRLTHLLVYDRVTDFIRNYFEKSDKLPARTMFEILYCPWCTGVWIALFVGFFYFLTPLAWYPIFFVALAGLGSILQIISILILRITPSHKNNQT